MVIFYVFNANSDYLNVSLNSERLGNYHYRKYQTSLHLKITLVSSVIQSCPTVCDPIDCSMPGLPVHVHCVSDAIQPPHPLSSPSPSTFNLSQHQGLFQWKDFCIRWPRHWSFSFSISPSNEYSGPVSFRMDWLDLLAVQATLESLLQHHSSKASIVWHSAFFIVQLSHPYMTTGKTIALTTWTFVDKVMSLLFNMLSRLHNFSPKEQASLNFMASATICSDFGAPQNKVSPCFHCFPICLLWSDGAGCHDLSFLNIEY